MRLKQWVTVADAARYLSAVVDTEVSSADVLQLALEGRLTLSVRFVNPVTVRPYEPLSAAERAAVASFMRARRAEVAAAREAGLPLPKAKPLDRSGFPSRAEHVATLPDGVFDLPLTGGERLDVEHEYQRLTLGPPVTSVWLDETLIRTSGGELLEVMARFDTKDCDSQISYLSVRNYFPPGTLGPDAVFVVRPSALRAFEESLAETPTAAVEAKPLQTRERSTLLAVVAALAKQAGIDVSHPSKAAEVIEAHTVTLGARVAARTIEEHLKRVPEALERRG